ncbi:MAG: peptide deformylase [Gemmatimonadetes bacterium]|nr:peptide deformylase [Gemmatimonadota bacterium]
MSVVPIHLLGSPVLKQTSEEVGEIDSAVRKLVDDLKDTMYAASGIGLAANQIGVTRRIAVVKTEEAVSLTLIDPVILSREGTDRGEEGCLSIPELYADIDRSTHIVVETTDLDGNRVRLDVADLRARAIQHEIDHLDGVLFLDHLSPLKRRLLLQKWKKLRKGKTGYIQEVSKHNSHV